MSLDAAANQPASRLRVLFLCGKNKARSPTAARLYAHDPRFEVRSAGVSPQAVRRVSEKDLRWAELVMVMEKRQASRLAEAFPDFEDWPQVLSLEVPDDYEYMDEELIELLQGSVEGVMSLKFEVQNSKLERAGDDAAEP